MPRTPERTVRRWRLGARGSASLREPLPQLREPLRAHRDGRPELRREHTLTRYSSTSQRKALQLLRWHPAGEHPLAVLQPVVPEREHLGGGPRPRLAGDGGEALLEIAEGRALGEGAAPVGDAEVTVV